MSAAAALATPTAAPRQRTALQRKCACGQAATGIGAQCEDCQRRQLFGIGPTAAPGTGTPADPGTGQSLDVATRGFFEARFGHGFGDVRIHAGDRAAAAARALNAHAYTSGRDIVFARGRYDPASAAGRHLLAHELTHVVQQRSALLANAPDGHADPAEREAEHNAERLHKAEPLQALERAPADARQPADTSTVTVDAPTGPPGCTLDQHHAIEPAVRGAQDRLQRTMDRLDAYIAAPADAANQAVAAALTRHFRRADAALATTVRQRIAGIRTDMVTRDPFPVECHDATDGSCANSGAYVRDNSELVFCPDFFTGGLPWRIEALTHEMAHALAGLDIHDRAYRNDRLLPQLSTAEALDNAESYTLFVSEVDSGRPVQGAPPQDQVEDCSSRNAPLVREAVARAQRWNRDAEVIANDQRAAMVTASAPFFTTHLGDALPATRNAARRVLGSMVTRLRSSLDVRCDNRPAAACSASHHAYKGATTSAGEGALTGLGIGAGIGLAGGLAGGIALLATGAGALAGLGALGLGGLIGMALGAAIGAIVGAATARDQIRLCPGWATLPSMEDRTEALLAAAYETYGGLNTAQAARYAAFARAVERNWWAAPPPV